VIISIEGQLIYRITLSCVIEAYGVGYEIFTPLTIKLPSIGEIVRLWIYAIYREDSQVLYGFNEIEERNFFKLVIEKVQGIGPKTAQAMLSKFPLDELNQFIAMKNASILASIPGVGKKTAEKIILELYNKVGSKNSDMKYNVENVEYSDAILGLTVLGYKRSEAEMMIVQAIKRMPNASADQLIKDALTVR
jgi:Holliday junction DNA helicase RuvA